MKENEILIACAGALDRYGERHQILKAVEEMGELQQALAKYLNALDEGGDPDAVWRVTQNVEEEIADLSLVMRQLRMIFSSRGIARWEANKAEKLRAKTREWRDGRLKKLVDDIMAQPADAEADEAPAAHACKCGGDGCCEIRMG